MSLESEIHQSGMDDVVLMVPESYLGTTQFLSEIEQLLASLPGAEEAGRLLF